MRYLQLSSLVAALAIAPVIFAGSNTNGDFPVTITVDAAKPLRELTPIWRFFGADEADYAYMKDGKKLLGELGQLGGPQVFFARTICSRAAMARMR
jgi:xylan 1,4-beta-xylosidase